MKILNYYRLMLIMSVLFSCGNNEKKETNQKTNSVVNKIKTGNNLIKGSRDLAAESEALNELTPISVDILKAFFQKLFMAYQKLIVMLYKWQVLQQPL